MTARSSFISEPPLRVGPSFAMKKRIAGYPAGKARAALFLRIRLNHEKQYDSKNREHAKRDFLTIRRFGLPHEEPLAANGKKRDEPHQQAGGEPGNSDRGGPCHRDRPAGRGT